ncbi:pyrroline-5-carboxylate reductase [soil metagenome]
MSKNERLGIIGGGNLGISIAEGLLAAKYIQPSNLIITRRKISLLDEFKAQGIITSADNADAVNNARIVVLAVKPKQVAEVLAPLKGNWQLGQILVSVVTGVTIAELQELVGSNVSVMRAMPNTAIAIRESMTCIAGKNAAKDQVQEIVRLFDQLGKTVVIEEELMEASTVLGACGIAYALRFIRAATQGGIEIGFDSNTALLIASQTAKGAAALLLENGQHPEREIDKVTTPQGCTIVGLNEMEHNGFSSALVKGILASHKKIAKIH